MDTQPFAFGDAYSSNPNGTFGFSSIMLLGLFFVLIRSIRSMIGRKGRMGDFSELFFRFNLFNLLNKWRDRWKDGEGGREG